MKIKLFNQFITESEKISDNVIEVSTKVDDFIIDSYQKKYPDKWILSNKKLDKIWIKDKPNLFDGSLPEYVYHVSSNPNLCDLGIEPSSATETPLGYYDMSFFYLSEEDSYYGSMPYLEGENYLYEIPTDIPDVDWYEGFNESLDGEENITTNCFIPSEFINLIESQS